MSAPIKSQDNIDEQMLYVPRWARKFPPTEPALPIFASSSPGDPAPKIAPDAPADPDVSHSTNGPRMAPGIGGPNIDPPQWRDTPPFEGDRAVKELRHRMAIDPHYVPAPPVRHRDRPTQPWLWWMLFLLLAIVAAVGLALLLLSGTPIGRMKSDAAGGAAKLGELVRARPLAHPARLIVENQRAYANEPLPLGISLNGASGEEMVTLVGLAKGTKLSVGTPLGLTGWQVRGRDLGKTLALAPRDYVGVMDAAIDLRSPSDRLVDSRIVRLEWLPKKQDRQPVPELRIDAAKTLPVIRQLDPEEIATLLRRGQDLLKNGDIASARLVLRRAANAGNAQAALALGATYDPLVLTELGVIGFAPDAAQARIWYGRAAEQGSREAARRLEQLSAGAN
jgi:hypothetical protein